MLLCDFHFVRFTLLLVGCSMPQRLIGVSQAQICSDGYAYCQTEIEAAGQTCCLTQSQNTDAGPASPSAEPALPGAWQGSHWSAKFYAIGMTRPGKIPTGRARVDFRSAALGADAFPAGQRSGFASVEPSQKSRSKEAPMFVLHAMTTMFCAGCDTCQITGTVAWL